LPGNLFLLDAEIPRQPQDFQPICSGYGMPYNVFAVVMNITSDRSKSTSR